jgi:type VI secretion system secreted protein VgrG
MNNQTKNSATSLEAILGNSHIVYTKIVIDREEIENTNFKVTIRQKVADHDEFEIICPTETLEGFGAYPLTKSRNFLGEKITIKLKQFGEEAFSFNGIVTSVKTKKFDGYDGHVIISGYSPTILLENGLECQSFEKSTLKEIISAATQGYPQDAVEFILKPNFTDTIAYTVQYKESDYQFIKRLAARYGEWLYYNGKEIVFGNHNEEIIDLEEESEMFEYEMKMQVEPQKFTYVSYVPKYAKDVSVNSNEARDTNYNNPFLDFALQKSNKTFQKVPTSLYNHKLMEQGSSDLKDAVQLQKDKRANVFFVEGKSRKPELRVGALVKLTGYKNGDKAFSGGKVPLETYRIIEVNHTHEGMDDYYNTFVAVPREIMVPHYMNDDAVPLCEEQSAIVRDNHDPDGMSRIRVQFPWQKGTNGESPWIRVTTPYAGKGKGFHVIPEKGEEVIVGFENGNAEKPFVLGAMFHAEGKSGHGGAGNFMKGFTTASGSKLILNDKDGSITISDKTGGNTIIFDGTDTIKIMSINKVEVTSKNISFKGEDTVSIESKAVTITGSETVDVSSSKASLSLAKSGDKATLSGKDVTVDGSNTSTVNGNSKATLNATGQTIVSGAIVKLN